MPYDLDQFIADCRASLTHDPGPKGREEVRVNLERLLANADFVREYCGDDVPRGLKLLYEDKALGFQVLAHINDKARVSPPHARTWLATFSPHSMPRLTFARLSRLSSPSDAARCLSKRVSCAG